MTKNSINCFFLVISIGLFLQSRSICQSVEAKTDLMGSIRAENCGAIALLTALKLTNTEYSLDAFKKDLSLDETNQKGLSLFDLKNFLAQRGFACRAFSELGVHDYIDAIHRSKCAIGFLRRGEVKHFLVARSDGKEIQIFDYPRAVKRFSASDFAEQLSTWEAILLIDPDPNWQPSEHMPKVASISQATAINAPHEPTKASEKEGVNVTSVRNLDFPSRLTATQQEDEGAWVASLPVFPTNGEEGVILKIVSDCSCYISSNLSFPISVKQPQIIPLKFTFKSFPKSERKLLVICGTEKSDFGSLTVSFPSEAVKDEPSLVAIPGELSGIQKGGWQEIEFYALANSAAASRLVRQLDIKGENITVKEFAWSVGNKIQIGVEKFIVRNVRLYVEPSSMERGGSTGNIQIVDPDNGRRITSVPIVFQ